MVEVLADLILICKVQKLRIIRFPFTFHLRLEEWRSIKYIPIIIYHALVLFQKLEADLVGLQIESSNFIQIRKLVTAR